MLRTVDDLHSVFDLSRALHVVIPGNPRGFVVGGHKSNSRTSIQRGWYALVRGAFSARGFRVPLYADKNNPLFFVTAAYYSGGVHFDPENTHKGLKDALFYDKRNRGDKDKHTGGVYLPPQYDSVNPRCECWVMGWYADLVLDGGK